MEPTELDRSCRICGAPVEVTYKEEVLLFRCTECEGRFGSEFPQDLPPGTLEGKDFPPAGLSDRTIEEVFAASKIGSLRMLLSFIRGVCPECSGLVEESVRICNTHDVSSDRVCPSCGTMDEVKVRYVCSVCKSAGVWPADAATYNHPVIVAFCHEQGLDLELHADDPEACARIDQHHVERDYTLISKDPVRIRVTVPGKDATLALTLNGNLNVVEVARE